MMCPAIDKPTNCRSHAAVHFLLAKNRSAVEIHHELWVVYVQNVLSEGTVRQWYRMCNDGQTMFMMKGKVVGHL
jgi:hypothetical protein